MTEKEVTRWLLSKMDDEGLYKLFLVTKSKWNGFRINSPQDVKSKRNMFINNLANQNYQKALNWFKITGPYKDLQSENLDEKELNELEKMANQYGAVPVLCQLFHLESFEKATQLYALLKDNEDELLKVPDKSYGDGFIILENEESTDQTITTEVNHKLHKVLKSGNQESKEKKRNEKLQKKIENLEKELIKRDGQYKLKLTELKGRHQEVYQSLQQKYDNTKSENKTLKAELEECKFKLMNSEKKKEQLSKFNLKLEIELKKARSAITHKQGNQTDPQLEQTKQKVLVIGEVASQQVFHSSYFSFTFMGTENLQEYVIDTNFSMVWVLNYGMTTRNLYYLNQNQSYIEYPKEKIKQINHFSEVQLLLNQSRKYKARIM